MAFCISLPATSLPGTACSVKVYSIQFIRTITGYRQRQQAVSSIILPFRQHVPPEPARNFDRLAKSFLFAMIFIYQFKMKKSRAKIYIFLLLKNIKKFLQNP